MSGPPLSIWLLQTGEPMPFPDYEGRPMRAIQLAECLVNRGHSVKIWTSDFDHQHHRHHNTKSQKIRISANLEIQTIYSRGYRSNVSIGRLIDHAEMARELSKLLREEGQSPDVAFVGFPPIEVAHVMSRWLVGRKVPFVLDVKDQWPDVLARAFPPRLQGIARILLTPYFSMTKSTLRSATAITSISEPFLEWTLEQSNRSSSDGQHRVHYLATETPPVSDDAMRSARTFWDSHGILDDGEFRASFVGSMSSAFDFSPLLSMRPRSDIKFVICGSGSQDESIRRTLGQRDDILLPGWIGQAQAIVLAQRSSVAIAPYKRLPDFQLSLPNKFFDALAYGLPMVTSLDGELGRIIQKYGVGAVYSPYDALDFEKLLLRLKSDPGEVQSMAAAARQLHSSAFSRDIVYPGFAQQLEQLVSSNE